MFEPKIRIYTSSLVKQGRICEEEANEIQEFITRLYNAVLNQSETIEFTLRDVLGGFNRDWNDTPLQKIYNVYFEQTNDRDITYQRAAREAGVFLKRALDKDERTFTAFTCYRNGKKLRAYRMVIRA